MPTKKYTLDEKKRLLIKLIELLVMGGYDISHLVGKPLNYFDFYKIDTIIIPKYLKEIQGEI